MTKWNEEMVGFLTSSNMCIDLTVIRSLRRSVDSAVMDFVKMVKILEARIFLEAQKLK